MSRIYSKIGKTGDEPVEAKDILAALAGEFEPVRAQRQEAVRRYLSASDGWREASNILGGAFAAAGAEEQSEKDE